MLGFQMAFDVTGDPAFPERAAFEVARDLGAPVTTHAGVWGATNDDGIRLMHENGFCHARQTIYVHAATLSERLLPAHRGDRRLGLGRRPRASRAAGRATRPPGRCARTTSRSRCRWTPASGGAATCSPRCAPRSARTAPASTSRRTRKGDTVTNCHLRAEQVVEWATRGGAQGARPGRRRRQPRGRARRPTSC